MFFELILLQIEIEVVCRREVGVPSGRDRLQTTKQGRGNMCVGANLLLYLLLLGLGTVDRRLDPSLRSHLTHLSHGKLKVFLKDGRRQEFPIALLCLRQLKLESFTNIDISMLAVTILLNTDARRSCHHRFDDFVLDSCKIRFLHLKATSIGPSFLIFFFVGREGGRAGFVALVGVSSEEGGHGCPLEC